MQRKREQHELAGTSSLRGGKNQYSAKTKLGNWVEEEYNPAIPVGGFAGGNQFITTTREMQMSGAGVKQADFGQSLKAAQTMKAEPYNYENIINADNREKSSNWKSITQSAHTVPSEQRQLEFKSSFKLRGGMSSKELEEYRERYTKEAEGMTGIRYQTEKNNAYGKGVNPRYRQQLVRWIPGAPPGVEKLREKIIERQYFSAFHESLISAVGREVDSHEFYKICESLGIKLSAIDQEQAWNFLSKGAPKVEVDRLVRVLRGEVNDKRRAAITRKFEELNKKLERVTPSLLCKHYDPVGHPGVKTGEIEEESARKDFDEYYLWKRIPEVTLEDFLVYYSDISAEIFDDDYFQEVVDKVWDI